MRGESYCDEPAAEYAAPPVVIYAAKSTTDVRGSIPTQLEDCRRTASRDGWVARPEWEFSDEAYSAFSGDRGPGLAAARELAAGLAVERGRAILLAQHSDRFARGDGRTAQHLGEMYFWAIKSGVELRSTQDDATFSNPLLAFAMDERNTEDSRRKALAVKAGMRRRAAERGKLAGGPRPYGYRLVGPKLEKRLEVIPGEAEVVRRMYRDMINGVSQMALARALTAEGVPTVKGGNWLQAVFVALRTLLEGAAPQLLLPWRLCSRSRRARPPRPRLAAVSLLGPLPQ